MKLSELAIFDHVGESLPSRERELKRADGELGDELRRSLPSRERELKRPSCDVLDIRIKSLPSRERELKLQLFLCYLAKGHVAPFTGA